MPDNKHIANELKKHFATLGMQQGQIAEILGISQQAVSALLNGKPFGKKTATTWAEKFNLQSSWLLTGEGEMLKNQIRPDAKEKAISDFVYVPMVPVRAKAGYLIGFGDTEYIETLPTIPVMTDRTFHGRYRCFEVEGDSMDDGSRDALCDKDVVLAREIKKELWNYKLHYKAWDFVIVHKDGILIKSIVGHDVERGIITCHSKNPFYGEDFDLELNDVYELYNVIKLVDRSIKK